MANAFYSRFLQGVLNKELIAAGDSVKASLIDSADYTFSASDTSHDLAAFSSADVAQATLANRTNTNGVLDSDDFTWTAVTGDQCEAVVLWDDTPTTPVANPLIAFYDTGLTGMPVTPNGGDINFT